MQLILWRVDFNWTCDGSYVLALDLPDGTAYVVKGSQDTCLLDGSDFERGSWYVRIEAPMMKDCVGPAKFDSRIDAMEFAQDWLE